ncbi:MAG: hypothetical protein AAF629_29730 [Chloroflexota bacterium]
MAEARVVQLDPPIPCNATSDEMSCGSPATAAWVDPILDGENKGNWLLIPICEDCAQTASASYASKRVAEFYETH